MFRVLNSFPAGLANPVTPWLKPSAGSSKRSFGLTAVAPKPAIAVLEKQLGDWLAPRRASLSMTRLDGSSDSGDFKASFRFEADDCERHALAELVQRLCVLDGVRYVRLEPGALPFSTGVFHE
jgi:hypothetical protein